MSEESYVGGVPAFVFEENFTETPVRGLSGDILEVTCLADTIDIKPQLWSSEHPHFSAAIRYLPEGTTMSFSVKTKQEGTDDLLHPDLNAARLLFKAINYFDRQTGGVERIEATWREGSVNHSMFYRTLLFTPAKDLDSARRQAAFSTWTAQRIALQQFVRLEYVKESGDSDGAYVDAMFSRDVAIY